FSKNEVKGDVHQTLARLILERKLPTAVARVINFFLSAITRARNEKNIRDRLEIISAAVKADKVKN
ncbi:hypothetical protein B6D29_00005, partial [Microgenomates bacterium UTCPR1]